VIDDDAGRQHAVRELVDWVRCKYRPWTGDFFLENFLQIMIRKFYF
jgi:hypothetical protein